MIGIVLNAQRAGLIGLAPAALPGDFSPDMRGCTIDLPTSPVVLTAWSDMHFAAAGLPWISLAGAPARPRRCDPPPAEPARQGLPRTRTQGNGESGGLKSRNNPEARTDQAEPDPRR